MARGMRLSRVMGILLLVVGTLLSAPISAQNSGPDKETAAKVLRLVKDANDEFKRGEFRDAMNLYQEAYDLYPNVVLLYRIAEAAEKSGELRRAVDAYTAFADGMKKESKQTEIARQKAQELLASIPPQIKVTSDPAGAEVFINSVDSPSVGVTPGSFDVPAGEVELVIRLDGYRVEKRKFSLQNGDVESADVALTELEGIKVENPPPPQTDGGGSTLATVGAVTTGVGVALLGTGAVFAILTQSAVDDVNDYDKRAEGASRGELQDLKDKAKSRRSLATTTFVAGGVVTAVGVGLLAIHFASKKGGEESATIQPAGGFMEKGAWLGLRGTF